MSLEPVSAGLVRLPEAAGKFLNFMANVRTASAQTLRSYRSDLSQAFSLTDTELPKISGPDGSWIAVSVGSRAGAPPRLPDTELAEACRRALQGWSGLAPASRNRKAATLKSFLGWLHDEGAIERDLAAHIHAPKVPVRLPHHLSADEALALVRTLRDLVGAAETEALRARSEDELAVVLLLYGGGLRVSEACGLKWAQIQWGPGEGAMLRVIGKGGKERIVALPPLVRNVLAEVRRRNGREIFVFGSEPLSTRSAYEIVRSSGAKAGLLQPLHPHALRHSFATHLLASGANLRTLQELLGHQTLQATQRYTHLGVDQLARTLEEFHPLGESGAGPSGAGPSGAERRKK